MGEGTVKELDAQSFESTVLAAQGSVVVDFWAPWCGPCKMVGPVLEKMAGEHADKVSVAKVNVDDNQELAARYGIMSIPTVILFEDGKVKTQLVGARSQKDYEREFGLV
jgi:thioredoxin 1